MVCSQVPRDVFLVVDGSASIGVPSFDKIKTFLYALVKSVVVNENMTHFGLLQFSSIKRTRVEFSLDHSHKEAVLLNAVKRLRYISGDATFTGNAIKIVDEQVSFSKEISSKVLVTSSYIVHGFVQIRL